MTTKPKADDFDTAFSEASKNDDEQVTDDTASDDGASDGADDEAAAAAAAAEEGDDGAAADDDAAKGGEDADAGAGGDPDSDAAGDGGAGEKGGKEDDAAKGDDEPLTNEQLLERMSQLLGKGSAEQHQQQQTPKGADDKGADDKGADDKGTKEEAPPLYTEEEQQLLETYRNDWPDIARAEALSRRQEYQQLIQFVFAQVKQALDPISETVSVMSDHAHLSQLQEQITDYDDVRDKVVKWVEDQPTYLRAAYEHVITQGTAEEVADLVERYRKENGVEPPKAKASSDEQRQQSQDTELPAATKKAAAGLAPVRSKRSTPQGSADPADFDAAFAEFAKKI